MAENNTEDCNRKRIRQPPAVPFLWEVRPGIPKRDWRPEPPSPALAGELAFPSMKLIASVPFVWEDKPGTPLSSPRAKLIDPPLLLLPPPLLDSHETDTSSPFNDGQEKELGSEEESFGSQKNETYSIPRVPSRRVKLVASVPFVWEEKPGTPLPYFSPLSTDIINVCLPLPPPPSWNTYEEVSSSDSNTDGADDTDEQEEVSKPSVQSFTFEISEPCSFTRVSSRPVKFVPSVPFMWEEKPGKPLSSFPQANPPPYSDNYDPELDLCNDFRDPEKQPEEMSEWEIESFHFETDEEGSFSSTHSLLANCLMPSSAISTAVPVEEMANSTNKNSPKLAYSSSSTSLSALDTESSTSSYSSTGASGPVGPAFLEWLFPLFPPKSGFLENSGSNKRVAASTTNQDVEGEDFPRESHGSLAMRRPTTLEQLIMMSRKRSYRRKAVPMTKQNSSMHDFMKKSAFGCGSFGRKLIQGLNLKRQLRLKLV